jgi:hypothetical protein
MENKLLLGFIVFSLTASGLAYGQPFEYDVPFQYGDNGCAVFDDGPYMLAQCYMEETRFGDDPKDPENPYNLDTSTDDGCLEGYTRDMDNLPMCVLDEVIEKEALEKCFNDPKCPVGFWEDEDGNIVNNQEELDKDPEFVSNQIPDDSYKCGYDIGLYQNEDRFDVPIELWIDENGQTHVRLYQDQSVVPDNYTSEEDLAVQACLAQWDLEKRVKHDTGFGVSTVPNSEDIFQHHSDVAFGIPPISQDMVNQQANADFENTQLKNLICNGYYSNEYKISFGCDPEDPYVTDDSKKPTMEEVFPDWMAAKINQYNLDGGAEMAKEKQRENIFKQMDSLRKQLAGLN